VLAGLDAAFFEGGLSSAANTSSKVDSQATSISTLENVHTGERLTFRMVNECCPRFTSKVVHVSRYSIDDDENNDDFLLQKSSSENARKKSSESKQQHPPPYIFVGIDRLERNGVPGTTFQYDEDDWRVACFLRRLNQNY
jgi:hypothetical protein